jgi:hypothetical protein
MIVSRAVRRGGLVLGATLVLALAASPTPAPAQSTPWAAPGSEPAVAPPAGGRPLGAGPLHPDPRGQMR